MNTLQKNLLDNVSKDRLRHKILVHTEPEFIQRYKGNKLLFLLAAFVLFLLPELSIAQLTTLNVGGTNRSLFVYAPSGLQQKQTFGDFNAWS